MTEVELVVYRDRKYPSVWIDDKAGYPDKISSFLEKKGFQKLNADQLRKFVVNSIHRREAHKKLIVFSQDVVPETIAEDYYANTIFREYLDTGGNVLWIGDIPLFYIGKKDGTLDQAWKKGSPLYMLGIVPIFTETPEQAVTITSEGRMLGLKHQWSGRRPVMMDSGMKILAKSESLISSYYINVPERKQLSFWERVTSKVKRVKVGVERMSFEVEFHPPPEKPSNKERSRAIKATFHQEQANAWMKNYNETYRNSGFFRIWDYGPRSLTGYMLEELYNIAIVISKRLQ
jgi:hypothetical protein